MSFTFYTYYLTHFYSIDFICKTIFNTLLIIMDHMCKYWNQNTQKINPNYFNNHLHLSIYILIIYVYLLIPTHPTFYTWHHQTIKIFKIQGHIRMTITPNPVIQNTTLNQTVNMEMNPLNKQVQKWTQH